MYIAFYVIASFLLMGTAISASPDFSGSVFRQFWPLWLGLSTSLIIFGRLFQHLSAIKALLRDDRSQTPPAS